jgi:hypothetical protein
MQVKFTGQSQVSPFLRIHQWRRLPFPTARKAAVSRMRCKNNTIQPARHSTSTLHKINRVPYRTRIVFIVRRQAPVGQLRRKRSEDEVMHSEKSSNDQMHLRLKLKHVVYGPEVKRVQYERDYHHHHDKLQFGPWAQRSQHP